MKRTILIFGLLLLILVANKCETPDSAEEVLKKLESKGIGAKSLLSDYQNGTTVHTLTLGDPSNPPLLLIHGSPGDWSAWDKIIANDTVVNNFYILAVDRAGYGLTTVEPQKELTGQASVVEAVLEQLNINSNITMIGHSYGGAVAEQLLLNHPEYYSLGIFVAATLSPELMEPRWYNNVANWSAVHTILPDMMRVSNYEMMGLPEALRAIEPRINTITTPIVFIQGEDDVLVPYETTDYYKSIKKAGVEYVLMTDLNHFIPWTDPYLITDIIFKRNHLK